MSEEYSVESKIQALQQVYERVAFSPSGIMYSMLHYDGDAPRPFEPNDVVGKFYFDGRVGDLHLDGPWDYLHGENSIANSGSYLHAQSVRYQVTRSRDALREARRAFCSLRLIHSMGVEQGKPGWMPKPYGFRPSVQTSGDQYLYATYGLLAFHRIASSREKALIERMIIDFADYWMSVDYVLSYFGTHWDMKGETDSYNAIFAMINAAAYQFSGNRIYLREVEKLMQRETWTKTTRIESLRSQVQQQMQRTGQTDVVFYGATFQLAKDLLRPGEFLCWETTVHSAFVAASAEAIHTIDPTLLDGRLPSILAMWWKEWKYGVREDLMSYYWFAVDLVHDTWRPLPKTEILPRDQWLWGDPFTSYISQVRWMDPLARTLITSSIAAEHCPEVSEEAEKLTDRILANLTPNHLRWLYDPDGTQLMPEIDYYGKCLSSEVPSAVLGAYWARKRRARG